MTTTHAERSRRLTTWVTRITHEPDDGPAPEQPPHRELARRELAAYAARIRLTDLVHEHGSPFLVLDVDRVTTQLLALRRELPEAQIHFATTSLPHPAVIRAVDAFGASFAVASRGEIDLLEREGVAIGRCLHAQPVKTVADITGSYLRGIRTFVVDHPDEVAKFRGLASDFSVLVRLSFPNPGATSDPSSTSGIAPEEAGGLVAHCLRAGLRVSGFTFHVGSQTTSAAPWVHAIRRTLALMRRLEHAHGIRFDTLDIGGGFPVGSDEPASSFAELARGIRAALSAAPKGYRILIEPGRFVSAPAMTLVTRVVGTADHTDGRWAYLDEDLSGAYSDIPTEDVHARVFAGSELDVQPPVDETGERATRRLRDHRREPVTLAGPTTDSVDVVARHLPLPPLAVGDLLLGPMMGAYAAATATGSNGIAPTPVVVVPS